MSGARHRSHGGIRGHAVSLGVAGGAAVVLLGGLTATGIGLAATTWNNGSSDGCAAGSDRVALTITTAPTLAGPIGKLAEDYSRAHAGREDGQCVSIAVSALASDRVLDVLSRPASQESDGAPDIWIPESDDWLELAQESDTAASTLPAKAPAIAGSPVVIAMPRLMAQQLGWPEHHITWAELSAHAGEADFWAHQGVPRWGNFRFAMANPEKSAAGLRAVLGTVSAATGRPLADMTTGTFDQDRAAQLTVLRMERSIAWLPESDSQLFDSVRTGGTENGGAGTAPSAFPALESDVIAYNRSIASQSGSRPPTTLVASYPSDGMFTATVPYIVLKKTAAVPARQRVADAFADYVRGQDGKAALTAAGFRTPAELAGQDDPAGLSATLTATDGVRLNPPRIASTDASDSTLGTARRFFRHIHQREVTLTVLDTSGSMSAIVPGTDPPRTRMQMAVDASLTGLGLFAGDSDVGLWQLASNLDGPRGYRELSPLERLDAPGPGGTHRDDLVAAQTHLVPGGDTDLYATTLAAFRTLTQHYVPGRLNQVVILTDGRDDAPTSGDALSLDSLLTQLRAEYNPQRPVEVITIAYSDDADSAALQRISAATHARSYVSQDPRDVLGVYLDALTRAGT